MAGAAFKIIVRPVEYKPGLPIMIKHPQCPAVRIVTLAAKRPQGPVVLIIFFMAGITRRAGVLEFSGRVAFFAGDDSVLSDQREGGYIVIELNHVCPATLIVTILTMPALLPPVHVVNSVTTQAICFQFIFMHIALMTGTALQFFMFSL